MNTENLRDQPLEPPDEPWQVTARREYERQLSKQARRKHEEIDAMLDLQRPDRFDTR